MLASCRLARLGVGGWLRRGWHGPGSLEVCVSEHLRNTFRLAAPMAGYAGWLAAGLALTALRRIYSPIYSAFKSHLALAALRRVFRNTFGIHFGLQPLIGWLCWLAAGWVGWAWVAGCVGAGTAPAAWRCVFRNTFGIHFALQPPWLAMLAAWRLAWP